MTGLLVAKQYIKNFIARYEVYLHPLGKFLMAFIALLFVNGATGFMPRLNSLAIVFVVALMCSFMPPNFTIIVSGGFIIAHFYEASMECAVVVLAIFLLMFFIYYRFSPKDTWVILITPICFMLKIPYVIPLVLGLMGTPLSIVSAACGIITYYTITYISGSVITLSGMAADDMAVRFRFIIDGLMSNRAMLVMIFAFSATIIVVYLIRRMPIDHNWIIATITGALVNIMVLLLGDLIWDTTVSVFGAILGLTVSIGIAKVVEFFAYHVDYNRAESVQFEDDEYYYYVKAIPKITVAAPSRTVKKIHSSRQSTVGRSSR
ncbi:MAG: hypothetical protein FWC09_05235 [Lachnospiraceae bacterium]|nr:hypothetical protein [Lachnospiraceae bacterium]